MYFLISAKTLKNLFLWNGWSSFIGHSHWWQWITFSHFLLRNFRSKPSINTINILITIPPNWSAVIFLDKKKTIYVLVKKKEKTIYVQYVWISFLLYKSMFIPKNSMGFLSFFCLKTNLKSKSIVDRHESVGSVNSIRNLLKSVLN